MFGLSLCTLNIFPGVDLFLFAWVRKTGMRSNKNKEKKSSTRRRSAPSFFLVMTLFLTLCTLLSITWDIVFTHAVHRCFHMHMEETMRHIVMTFSAGYGTWSTLRPMQNTEHEFLVWLDMILLVSRIILQYTFLVHTIVSRPCLPLLLSLVCWLIIFPLLVVIVITGKFTQVEALGACMSVFVYQLKRHSTYAVRTCSLRRAPPRCTAQQFQRHGLGEGR